MNSKKVISEVIAGSIAEELNIKSGDILISINNQNIEDVFDYEMQIISDYFEICIENQNGEEIIYEIEKNEDEELGLVFEKNLMDDMKTCHNKCIFCFIDQLPPNLRDTLYIKDDDIRMSFLNGNYVTLTNIDEETINKIIRYRISPINISVHTTDLALRKKMMKNKYADNVIKYIQKLVDAKININCQIVAVRDVNDGEKLKQSIDDLVKFYPQMQSISVVPCGITKYRDGLYPLIPFDKESASSILAIIENKQKQFIKAMGSSVVFPSDEFFITAKREIPNYEYYENFPQIENGVGMIASFMYEIKSAIKENQTNNKNIEDKSIATGSAAYPYIKKAVELLGYKNLNVYNIKNNFFGENITVTGLLTGRDIIEQLKGKELGKFLLLSECMFKSDEDIMLDDTMISDLEDKLLVKVIKVMSSGQDFVKKVL